MLLRDGKASNRTVFKVYSEATSTGSNRDHESISNITDPKNEQSKDGEALAKTFLF